MNKTLRYNFFVYIMASLTGTLYVGVTNNLIRRVSEHKQGKANGFTQKYQCTKLVYYEHFTNIYGAIRREKEIKGWLRRKKEELIKRDNPHWKDLSDEFLK